MALSYWSCIDSVLPCIPLDNHKTHRYMDVTAHDKFHQGSSLVSFSDLPSLQYMHTASDQNLGGKGGRGLGTRIHQAFFQSSTTAIVACSTSSMVFVLQVTIAVVED